MRGWDYYTIVTGYFPITKNEGPEWYIPLSLSIRPSIHPHIRYKFFFAQLLLQFSILQDICLYTKCVHIIKIFIFFNISPNYRLLIYVHFGEILHIHLYFVCPSPVTVFRTFLFYGIFVHLAKLCILSGFLFSSIYVSYIHNKCMSSKSMLELWPPVFICCAGAWSCPVLIWNSRQMWSDHIDNTVRYFKLMRETNWYIF